MGRIVFRSSLLVVVLVTAAAKDIPISSSYVIRHTDSCPDVGYYFRREPAPNSVDPGPCLLCFCQGNGTAACWIRESKRCDVEKYHYNRVGGETRVRRSPVSLGDIFFRDATRDFFDKNLPEQCKPFEESFSDGCPPADWCTGCTVCDCDANGRWDCHILSFCNDNEKKKVNGVKIPPPKSNRIGKKGSHKHYRGPRTKKTTPKPIKKITPIPVKKLTKPEKKVVKKEIRKVVRKVNKHENKTQNINPKRRKIIIKRKADNQKIKQKRENPDQTIKDIVIKKEIDTHKPMTLSNTIVKGIPYNTTDNEYQLGQMLVKQVMSSVQKLVKTELDSLNKTMDRLSDSSDCEQIRRHNLKKKSPKEFKFKKIGEEFHWMRDKRDVSQQIATSYYDNGIETTTDNIGNIETLTSHPNNSHWSNEPDHSLIPLNMSQNTNEIDFKEDVNNDASNFEPVRALKNTSDGNNTVLDEKKESNVNLKIAFENNAAINKTNSINTTKQINNNIADVIPEFYNANSNKLSTIQNYKYNIVNSPTEKSKVITTTSTTNTPDKEKTESNVYKDQTTRVTKKYNLKKVFKKNFKELTSIYFPLNDVSNEKRPNKKLFPIKNKNILKKNSTKKLKTKFNFMKYIKKIFNKIFFGKKKKYLQQKDDEYQILRILCENINGCNINRKNRNMLKIKIRKINAECNIIFKTMKIIKGLLHLIDIPNYNNTSKSLKDDIRKLSVILKETGSFSKNLSDTQKIQIEYIKRNTKIFTESVGRFTELLNDIIFILQKNKQESERPPKLTNKNITESFEKIRKLILKHNLVENTFIKQIYNTLNDVENRVKSNLTQVSKKRTNNKVIEDYSRSIIENLRKLKGLAQALNSSRRKREAMREDDTVEYLLLLMEYLIRKDHPAPVEPVNDGIDLLIDTIKSAPDIKSIKKKVLENFPASVDSISASSGDSDKFSDSKDSLSDSSSMSRENIVTTTDDINKAFRAMTYEEDIVRDSYEKVNLINSTDHDFHDNVTETPAPENKPETTQEKIGFEKFESLNIVEVSSKKYETFVEDDDVYPTVYNNSAEKETTPLAEPYYEFHETTTLKIKENQSGDSTGNLEWIEENFGNEIREIRQNMNAKLKNESSTSSTTSIPITTTTTTTTTKAPEKKIVDTNISDVSEENNRKKKKLSTEDVMHRKQMDLLNSLDYGTPKSDFEDTKSEDDEKYISDTYF